jgi:predicted O-methyltransferase YrrM
MNDIILPVQKEYIENFRLKNDTLISEMEEYAKANNVPILSWDSAELLEILINSYSPKRVLEIGTAIAYSSIRIARNLKKKGVVHTIEKSEDNINVAKAFIEKAGLQDKINIIQGDALNVMLQLDKKYDFIFLDADKQDYKRLFDYCLILLKSGGILFVDNLLWKGFAANKRVPADYKTSTKQIRDFNSIFMAQKSLKTTILPVGDGIGLGVKL